MKKRILSFILAITIVISAISGAAVLAGAEEKSAELKQAALSLAENITVKMQVSVVSPDEGDFARVTLPDGATVSTPISEADRIGDDYLFYAEVALKDFSRDVTVEICNKDGAAYYTATTSAKAYCENYKSGYPESNGEFSDLIAALEIYAAAADSYFYKTAAVDVTADLSAVPDSETEGSEPDGLIHRGATLVLESETTLRHYFMLEDGRRITDYTFFVDLDGDRALDPAEKLSALKKVNSDGSVVYYADIEGISPNELDTAFTIGVLGGGKEYFCTYGALNYAKSKASAENKLSSLVKALYNYNAAAGRLIGTVSFDGTDTMTYEYGVATPIVKPVTKANSTFIGWSDSYGNIVTEIPASATGDIELISVWSSGSDIHNNGFASTNIYGANYCASHADTDSDEKCNSCNRCANVTACGLYTSTSCGSCGSSRANYVTIANIEWGSKSAAACAYPVSLGDGNATLFALNGNGTKYSVAASTGLCGILFDATGNAKTNAIAIDLTLGMPSAEQISDANDSAVVFGAVPEKYIKMAVQFGHASSRFNLFGISDDGYVTVLDSKAMKLGEGLNSFRIVIDTTDIKNDGAANDSVCVKLYGADGKLVTSASKALPQDISTYTRTNDVFRMDFNDSGYLLFDEFKIATLPLEENKVIYPLDATLPEEIATTFTPGTALPLADSATKSGYEFAGWYADAELTKPINEVPANAVGSYRVYAKWVRQIVNADYSTNTVVGNITYLDQGVATRTFENGYLLWQSTASNPNIYTSGVPLATINSEQITFMFDLADAGTDKDMSLEFYFKDKNNRQYMLLTTKDGVVKFNGREIVSLSETEFTRISMVVDFEKNEVRLATSQGYEVYVGSFDFAPQADFTKNDLYVFRAGSAGAIKIGSIKVYAGDLLAD